MKKLAELMLSFLTQSGSLDLQSVIGALQMHLLNPIPRRKKQSLITKQTQEWSNIKLRPDI